MSLDEAIQPGDHLVQMSSPFLVGAPLGKITWQCRMNAPSNSSKRMTTMRHSRGFT